MVSVSHILVAKGTNLADGVTACAILVALETHLDNSDCDTGCYGNST